MTEYQVFYRPVSTTKWTLLARTNGKTLKYVHKSSSKYPLKPGQRYVYTVKGYNKTFKTTSSYNKNGVMVQVPKKPSATVTPKPTVTLKPDSQEQVKKDIKEVIRLTNKVRKKYGSPAVKENAALDAGAAVRAKEAYQKFSHERPDGTMFTSAYNEAGAGNIAGENITTGNSPQRAVDLIEHSPGHLRTMLIDDATHIGVGYYKGCWVQVFARNPDQKFTLTVDANGGYFPDKDNAEKYTIQVPAGMTLYAKDIAEAKKDNSTLKGWSTICDGIESGIVTSAKLKLHMFDSLSLKANWTDNNSSD